MIKLECDICKKDSDRIGYNVTVNELDCDYESNTTKNTKTKNFLLCQKCYALLNIPNLHKPVENTNNQE